MNTTSRTLLWLSLAALASTAMADPLARGLDAITSPVSLSDPSVPHTPTGIEGNGLLGIEGNGITQRTDNGELVVNDSLYLLGPGKVRVTIDAASSTMSAIHPGHIVLAGARTPAPGETPMLALIELDHLVRGPIDIGGVSPAQNTIRVLSQELVLADFVELADATGDIKIDDLVAGDYLRVSGWLNADGDVVPTRIERSAPLPDTLEISGNVLGLDEIALTLQIGDMTVDYASAQFVYMTPNDLSLGERLEVVGNGISAGGELSATRIRRVPAPLSGEGGQEVEVQGYADQPIVANHFVLAGQSVSVSTATVYDRGVEADVQPGRLLEVAGVVAPDGTLLADRIEFDEDVVESEIRITGTVESVTPQMEQLVLFGLTVSADVTTRYEDHSGSATPFVDFSDVESGAFVEVRGYDDPDGSNFVATTRITRDMEDGSFIKARVGGNDGSAISLLGLTVWADVATTYFDANGTEISEQQFLARAQVGVLVKASGSPLPGGIDASRLEIE